MAPVPTPVPRSRPVAAQRVDRRWADHDPDDPFVRLDCEWATLCARRRHRATLRRWAATEPELAGAESLNAFVPACPDTRRAYMPAVLRLVRGGDELAARVLLQMLVPGLLQTADALHRPGLGPRRREVRLDVLSVAWTQVAAIAAGTSGACATRMILWNVRRETVRHLRRLRGAACDPGRRPRVLGGDPVPIDPVDLERTVTATAESVGGADEARVLLQCAVNDGVLSSSAAQLVWQVAVNDQPTNWVGADLGMTRLASYRARDRALDSLRTYLAAS